jgi:hypothetical protein
MHVEVELPPPRFSLQWTLVKWAHRIIGLASLVGFIVYAEDNDSTLLSVTAMWGFSVAGVMKSYEENIDDPTDT